MGLLSHASEHLTDPAAQVVRVHLYLEDGHDRSIAQ
jgi:hypothetical protein